MNEKRERCGFCEKGVIVVQAAVRLRGWPAIKRECWYCDGTGYVQERQ